MIRQQKEWGEILIGFESNNRFELSDDEGNGGSDSPPKSPRALARSSRATSLGKCRKATIHIYDEDGNRIGKR